MQKNVLLLMLLMSWSVWSFSQENFKDGQYGGVLEEDAGECFFKTEEVLNEENEENEEGEEKVQFTVAKGADSEPLPQTFILDRSTFDQIIKDKIGFILDIWGEGGLFRVPINYHLIVYLNRDKTPKNYQFYISRGPKGRNIWELQYKCFSLEWMDIVN